MKKLSVFFIFLLILTFLIPQNIVYAKETQYYLGGIPAGFTISERGARIIDTCSVTTCDGLMSPSNDAGLRKDDIILYINNVEVNSSKDIANTLKEQKQVFLSVKRDKEIISISVNPVKDIYGKLKLGVIVAEDGNGIGTITYFTDEGFGSLGHAIINDKKEEISIYNGKIYNAQITGVVKGEKGKAGELKGILFKDKQIGDITKNVSSGTYGNIIDGYNLNKYKKIEIGEAEIGKATVYTTVVGNQPKEYSIQIVKTDSLFKDEKNLVIKINSSELLDITNGIVQGMSGSPILQNGKLVGAVTHVFINDPTRGYGIKIQDMINK